VLVVILALLAAGLRLWRLESLPSGLHGDECVVGIKALRIINGQEPLTPYVPECGGFPAGAIWLTLLVIKAIGPHTILSVRLSAVIAGIVGVLALYFFARRWLPAAPVAAPDEEYREQKPSVSWEPLAIALLAGVLLAVSNWHLHLTRVGHALAPWPPFAILSAWAALEALRRAPQCQLTRIKTHRDVDAGGRGIGAWVLRLQWARCAVGYSHAVRRDSPHSKRDRAEKWRAWCGERAASRWRVAGWSHSDSVASPGLYAPELERDFEEGRA
jgi:hypothetical protein